MNISSVILIAGLLAAPAALAQTPPPGAANPPMQMQHRERHPEMRRALRALRMAKNALEHAAHDYHGHRAAALQHTNEAIAEVEVGLKSDQH